MLRVLRAVDATRRDVIEAATWLGDRGFGRPVQMIEHAGRIDSGVDLTRLSRDELRQVVDLLQKASGDAD